MNQSSLSCCRRNNVKKWLHMRCRHLTLFFYGMTLLSCLEQLSSLSQATFIILYLGGILTPAVSAQTWQLPPQKTSAAPGSDITLTCGVKNIHSKESFMWLRHNVDDTNSFILFTNRERHSAKVPSRYSISSHPPGPNADVFGYDLKIANLTLEDDKLFECSVQNFQARKVRVTVLSKSPSLFYINCLSTSVSQHVHIS